MAASDVSSMCTSPVKQTRLCSYRSYMYSPAALTKAFYLVIDEDESVGGAARRFGVPESTLRDRVMGRVDYEVIKSGPAPLFSLEEEARLVEHIKKMSLFGYGYSRAEVVDIASTYVINHGKRDEDHPLTLRWYRDFMVRWPELRVKKPQSLELQRAKATSEQVVQSYFGELDSIITKYNLKNAPERIYSIDEKELKQNHSPPHIVCLSSSTPSAVTSGKGPTVTIIGSGNALGQQIPQFSIFLGQRMRQELLQGCSPGTEGTVSETGWSNFHDPPIQPLSEESPGQPPGSLNNRGQPPSDQMTVSEGQRSDTENGTVKEKHNKETQPTPILCSQSKSKRRLDSLDGHDDGSCDPQLENLCRKKFKPIAPKPTVKKDQHQSVVTATVPIKEISRSDFGSSVCMTRGDGKNGAIMFVSPRVQLIPSVPIIAHAPLLNGDTLASNSSPFSMTVPLLPHGKYFNIMNPPAMVSMTDVAGHYKTVVQLLPKDTSNCCVQPGSYAAMSKTSDGITSSKPAPMRNEQSTCKNGVSTNKTSKTKTLSKPKASRYKYSLLMNGGSYGGNVLNAGAKQKLQTHITPAVSLNGGVRLSLPAVLTSSGVLQISVPSVGIANGQVQFCDGLPPADVVHTQSSVAQTTTAQPVYTTVVAPTVVAQTVSTPNVTTNATTIGLTQSNGSDSHTHHVSLSNTEKSAPNTNGLSLDETLKVMLRTPRATTSHNRQKETHQTKKTKPHRTCSSAAKSRHKEHKTHTSTCTSFAPLESVNSNACDQSGGRSGIANTTCTSSLGVEKSPTHSVVPHRAPPSEFVSDQRNIRVTGISQNVQYRPPDISENNITEQIPLGQDVIINHRSPGIRSPSYVINGETLNVVQPVTTTAQISTDPSNLSRLRDASSANTSVATSTHLSISNDLTNMPSQTSDQILDYGRQSSQPATVTTSNNLQSTLRSVNNQWSSTDTIAPRASSLPSFATGPRGFPTSTTTAPLLFFNVPGTTNHLAQQRPRDCVPVPSPMNFDQGTAVPVLALSAASIDPSMQSQQPQLAPNIVATTTIFVSHNDTVTSISRVNSRIVFSSNTSGNVIVRNSHSPLQRNSSSLLSNDVVYPTTSVQSAQILSETTRPPGNSLSSSNRIARHQKQNTNSHTAVTYSHNTVTSVHSANHGYPSVLSGSCNSNIPTRPTPPVPHERGGPSIREERGAVSVRRQLQLPDENPGNIHTELNGVGHNQPNNDLPAVISRQTSQAPVVQRHGVDTSVPRLNGVEAPSVQTLRPEQSLFTPPMPVVPHHAGILATAILRSRALERNSWGVPIPNVSTASTISNDASPTTSTSTLSTSAGYFGVTQAVTDLTNGNMSHTHHAEHVLHLRPAPGMPASLGRCRDNELQSWPATSGGILNRIEGDRIHTAQLILERQGRMAASPAGFSGARNAELEQPVPNLVTTTSGEQGQNMQAPVQSVPLHSNIPSNARNVMNEALQRRTRSQHIQSQSSATCTPVSVMSTQSHTSSVMVSSMQEGNSLAETQPAHLGTDRQEMITSDSQHVVRGQPRQELFPHQHPPHHMHTMPGTRLPSDSASHLPMPLMPPPSVLYSSSTPVPNLSMTPLHGVALPGSLSAHSVQGHGMTHQLHATPPPAPHHGQSTGPACNPQGPVNHMFVPTPYGPIHRSLYMPPPSPHPPDLGLMSPRSYGQVHMHDSVLYSPRFSSPIRNISGSSLPEGMFGSTLPRSFSEDRLDTCCSGPYAHSPPIHDNSSHMFPPGFMSPSMSRNQPSLQTSLCNTLQIPFNHRGHPSTPERLPGPFFHESMMHPAPHHLHVPVTQTSSFASTTSAAPVTDVHVCSSLDTSVLVSAAPSCNQTQQTSLGSSLLVSAVSPVSSTTVATTPGSTTSTSTCESTTVAPSTPTSPSSTTPVRVFNLGSTSDKYLPLELVVSPPSTVVTTSVSVTTLPAQLGNEQIVKFGDVMLECSRQILRESGRTVLCCWSCDYHTAEPKKMYRHQRRDEQPMKCQLCSHMGVSRCQLNQHFKEVHMDKDEDPFRTSAVT